jgi:protein dithiol:quinone oxidoreductase
MLNHRPFYSRRLAYLLGALSCAALIAFALYLQYQLGEDPCPLCIFQRIAVIVTGVIFFLAAAHGPTLKGARFYAGMITCSTGVGGAIALRHIWIQHLPKDRLPECGPGLSYMIETFPFTDVIRKVLTGSGECATVGWTFLTLSIPEWTLICFLLLLVWAWWITRPHPSERL